MTNLFELKERILRFCSSYEGYLIYAYKFVLALILFGMINGSIGFVEAISTWPIAIALALGCCLLSMSFTAYVAMGLVLVNLFALSPEVALVALLVFGIVFFLYFRFSPHDMVLFTITPVMCAIGIPYVLPIAAGLLRKRRSVTALVGGAFVYYFVAGIYQNINALKLIVAGVEIDSAKLSIAVGQVLENKEMHMMLFLFAITTIVVYSIRRTSMQYAWKMAIVVGVLIQMSGMLIGYILLDVTNKMIGMLVGNLLAALMGFAIEFMFMDLDYSRTERVQMEDDEYYYFVKAIPKKMVASTEKTVKEFNGTPGFALKMKSKKKEKEGENRAES